MQPQGYPFYPPRLPIYPEATSSPRDQLQPLEVTHDPPRLPASSQGNLQLPDTTRDPRGHLQPIFMALFMFLICSDLNFICIFVQMLKKVTSQPKALETNVASGYPLENCWGPMDCLMEL
jgi:hypothetical protein